MKESYSKKEIYLFELVDDMIDANYPIDHRACVKAVIDAEVPAQELQDIYTMYDICYGEYLEQMSEAYLKYKSWKIRESCKSYLK